MDNETLFYAFGIVLAASALVVTFLGLKMESFPGRLGPIVGIWFAVFVLGVTTTSVLHAQDEHEHEAAASEHASEEIEAEEGRDATAPSDAEAQGGTEEAPQGAGSTLQLAADPTEIAFDKTSLSTTPGEVTIDFDNPATVEHNVAVEQGSEILAESETITEGRTSVTVDLQAGKYVFVCTVPGHEEAGMKGTLTVK